MYQIAGDLIRSHILTSWLAYKPTCIRLLVTLGIRVSHIAVNFICLVWLRPDKWSCIRIAVYQSWSRISDYWWPQLVTTAFHTACDGTWAWRLDAWLSWCFETSKPQRIIPGLIWRRKYSHLHIISFLFKMLTNFKSKSFAPEFLDIDDFCCFFFFFFCWLTHHIHLHWAKAAAYPQNYLIA